jgi:lipopolysaccharide/colanic/teichoic acid biosynthesis glycosyltransferase
VSRVKCNDRKREQEKMSKRQVEEEMTVKYSNANPGSPSKHSRVRHLVTAPKVTELQPADRAVIQQDAGHQHQWQREVLSSPVFLRCLRYEKLRAERSEAPLSVTLFGFGEENSGNGQVSELLASLQENTRETDIKGWIDQNTLGLILPDTDKVGVQHCLRKIIDGKERAPYSITTATYPDRAFQKLLVEGPDQPDYYPHELDDSLRHSGLETALKRTIDIIGSLVGLSLASPLIFLTILAIKTTSPGPVIFKQTRLGKKGIRFSFYKFRSMYWNTDDRIHRDYIANLIKGNLEEINEGVEGKPLYKMKSDPRVTPVGKIIRKLSIDEVPQFFNVLKGEMSLVGPRPPIPYEVERYKLWHLRRVLDVKPGITGLWQVDGRSKTSFDDMVRLDLRYARDWSLWLDVKILLKTVRAVLRSSGAV